MTKALPAKGESSGSPGAEKGLGQEDEEAEMPFMEHLRELRTRLRNAIIALLFGFLVAFIFKQELFVLLVRPLQSAMATMARDQPGLFESALYFTSPVEVVWVYISIAFWAGLFLASPFIFYQLWKFIGPGLYKDEQRYGVWFAITSALLFSSGAYFCYAVALQPTFEFLLGYSSENLAKLSKGMGVEYELSAPIRLQPLLTMDGYLAFAKKFIVGFGLVFELPLVVFFLSKTGAVDHRVLWKFNRYAIVLAFVVAAILTPPDYLSQIIMAGPIVVMYNLSIIVSWVVTRRREAKEQSLSD